MDISIQKSTEIIWWHVMRDRHSLGCNLSGRMCPKANVCVPTNAGCSDSWGAALQRCCLSYSNCQNCNGASPVTAVYTAAFPLQILVFKGNLGIDAWCGWTFFSETHRTCTHTCARAQTYKHTQCTCIISETYTDSHSTEGLMQSDTAMWLPKKHPEVLFHTMAWTIASS